MAQVCPALMSTHSKLNYYLHPSQGGKSVFYPGTAGYFRRPHDVRSVKITDIRSVPGTSEEFSLERQGFELLRYPCSEKEFIDQERVTDVAYPETVELLKKRTGATKVVPMSYLVRNETGEKAAKDGEGLQDAELVKTKAAVHFVHVDHSYNGAREMLYKYIDMEEAERLSKTRWGIINVWRPIQAMVSREPLAVCDARTVDESDLHPVIGVHPPKGTGKPAASDSEARFETWQVTANSEHKWYYVSQMTPEEVLLIKIFDSKLDGRARRVPHTAVSTPDDFGPPRQSIEIRCLVFWEHELLE